MKQKRNANFSILLAIFLGSVLACLPRPGAAAQDKGSNEKLLAAIRDADAQTAKAFLSDGADANASDQAICSLKGGTMNDTNSQMAKQLLLFGQMLEFTAMIMGVVAVMPGRLPVQHHPALPGRGACASQPRRHCSSSSLP
ncbi:MAG: hypothetical protein ACREAB_09120 [Blastocatellia bacterium]